MSGHNAENDVPELGDRTKWFKAQAWDECAKESHALGWLHDWALSDLLARNPYRTRVIAPEKGDE